MQESIRVLFPLRNFTNYAMNCSLIRRIRRIPLFPNLKKWLGGKRFYSNDEIISQTNTYSEDLEKSYLLEGVQKLEQRWTKCKELKGDYIEK